MTTKQQRYAALFAELSRRLRADAVPQEDEAELLADIKVQWLFLSDAEREPFLHWSTLRRVQEGPVNRDFAGGSPLKLLRNGRLPEVHRSSRKVKHRSQAD